MKKEFIDFLNALINAAPEVAEKLMTDEIRAYINSLMESKTEKPPLTENGKIILKFLQDNTTGLKLYKAKDIADNLYVSSKKVSGSIRKLVTDGFVEKVGESPATYSLTEKGKEFIIED